MELYNPPPYWSWNGNSSSNMICLEDGWFTSISSFCSFLNRSEIFKKIIMELPINTKLIQIRFMSFYRNSRLICEKIAVFLKFSNEVWYKVTSIDGISHFEITDEPKSDACQKDVDEFHYPISRLDEYNLENLGKLKKIDEYFWKGKEDESYGFILGFENGKFLTIIEKDDCLYININNEDNQQDDYELREKLVVDYNC